MGRWFYTHLFENKLTPIADDLAITFEPFLMLIHNVVHVIRIVRVTNNFRSNAQKWNDRRARWKVWSQGASHGNRLIRIGTCWPLKPLNPHFINFSPIIYPSSINQVSAHVGFWIRTLSTFHQSSSHQSISLRDWVHHSYIKFQPQSTLNQMELS